MAYSDIISIDRPRHLQLFTGAASGEIPIIDSQRGNFTFSATYEQEVTDRFIQGKELLPFSLEAWVIDNSEVRMGHAGQTDGVTVDDTSISVKISATTHTVSNLDNAAKHVVFTYSNEAARLYLNGELIFELDPVEDSVAFVNEATVGMYKISTTAKYDGFAFYDKALDGNQIVAHYEAGRAVPAFFVQEQYGVQQWIPHDGIVSHTLVNYDTSAEWEEGDIAGIVIEDNKLKSAVVDGDEIAGTWRIALPIDQYTKIYGIKLEEFGTATYQYKLNDSSLTAWSDVTMIQAPFSLGNVPAGAELEIYVNFAAGTAAEVKSLQITLYHAQTYEQLDDRTVTLDTVTLPSVIHEPNEFHERAGMIVTGTATFGTTANSVKQIFIIAKPGTGTMVTIGSVTLNANGSISGAATVSTSTLTNGWRHYVITLNSNLTTAIVVDNCTLLAIATSTSTISTYSFNALYAKPVLTVTETTVMNFADDAPSLFQQDWSFTGAGG
jgi:hypothetical protein